MPHSQKVLCPGHGAHPVNRREVGALGEKIAADYLQKEGYRIRERNFRLREGEIDIIAEKDDFLVFVEVRTRASSSFGTAEESVTRYKIERLITVAQSYIQSHQDLPPSWRIDVVAVDLTPRGRLSRIELIEDVTS
ncbi:MAG: YraN family protein [Chloroflexi bacterium]|nr:YraN family protein [Chloroflexota bacterium]